MSFHCTLNILVLLTKFPSFTQVNAEFSICLRFHQKQSHYSQKTLKHNISNHIARWLRSFRSRITKPVRQGPCLYHTFPQRSELIRARKCPRVLTAKSKGRLDRKPSVNITSRLSRESIEIHASCVSGSSSEPTCSIKALLSIGSRSGRW